MKLSSRRLSPRMYQHRCEIGDTIMSRSRHVLGRSVGFGSGSAVPVLGVFVGILMVFGPAVAHGQRVRVVPAAPPSVYHSLGGTGLHYDIRGTGNHDTRIEVILESVSADWLVPRSMRLARWIPSEQRFDIVWNSQYDSDTRRMSGVVSRDGIYTVFGLSRASFVYGAQQRLHDLFGGNIESPSATPGFGRRLCSRILCPAINYAGWTDECSETLGRTVGVPEIQAHFGGICDMCWAIELVPFVLPERPLIEVVHLGPPDFIVPPISCPDTDGDTVYDCLERCIGSDPNDADSDSDGLDDGFELALGTKLENSDSDGDILGDYDEYFVHHTSPLMPDTDGDGLSDGTEWSLQTNPLDDDSDGDGLPDQWEVEDPAGLGVDPRHKDLIVEVDWMCADTNPANNFCDPGEKEYKPSISTQNAIESVFLAGPVGGNPDGLAGVNLILRVSPVGIPLAIPAFEDNTNPLYHVDADGNQSFTQTYYDIKGEYRDSDLIGVSRYCLFIDEFSDNVSGMAEEIPSDDFVVSLGNSSIDGGWPHEQVGAFLHELGHTLGLYHGGSQGEGCHPRNLEPNYPSVMNYWHTFSGIQGSWLYGNPPDPSQCDEDNTFGHLCFVGSGGMFSVQQTYSQGLLAEVDELDLDETAGFGSIPAQDLNFDGTLNTSVWVDIQGDGCMEVLDDFDDWANLVYKVW